MDKRFYRPPTPLLWVAIAVFIFLLVAPPLLHSYGYLTIPKQTPTDDRLRPHEPLVRPSPR